MAHLASSNLSVNSIKTMLNVTSLRTIFYKGVALDTLKSVAELGAVVNKLWLSSACPGANADAKLQNLLNDRKLSYFKGYGYSDNFTLSPAYGMTFTRIEMTGLPTNITFPVTSQQTGYMASQGIGSVNVEIGGTYMANRFISIQKNSSEVARMEIHGTGWHYMYLPVSAAYPDTLRISIVS